MADTIHDVLALKDRLNDCEPPDDEAGAELHRIANDAIAMAARLAQAAGLVNPMILVEPGIRITRGEGVGPWPTDPDLAADAGQVALERAEWRAEMQED